jgi:hypothetical protein
MRIGSLQHDRTKKIQLVKQQFVRFEPANIEHLFVGTFWTLTLVIHLLYFRVAYRLMIADRDG